MQLDQATILKLAEHIDNAQTNHVEIHKITDDYPQMDYEDAYAIQYALRERQLARGNKIVGLKMGLTSHAKMKQMGVENAVYGYLLDSFACQEGAEISVSDLIHPKVEAEIAFVTKSTIKGKGCHIGTVLSAIDFVVPAVEVIDSRYENFRFDLKSVIADNTSAAKFVTGGRIRSVDELDLRTLGVVVEKNGEVMVTAAGASVLGHPAASVAMLANLLAERGEDIPAGTFIMTGGITEAIAVQAGDNICVRFQDLGSLTLKFVA